MFDTQTGTQLDIHKANIGLHTRNIDPTLFEFSL